MKKVLSIVALSFLVTISYAQNTDRNWGLGVLAGNVQNLAVSDNDIAFHFYLNHYLSSSFDVQFKQTFSFFASLPDTSLWLDNSNTILGMRFKFNNGTLLPVNNRFKPFLSLGVGYLYDNDTGGINFDADVGAKYGIKSGLSLVAKIGYIHGIDSKVGKSTRHDNFLRVSVGVEFAFGRPADSDKDGVPDSRDNCPGTESGLKVDKFGCLLDSDGDGISDVYDKCPKLKGDISFDGCPDSDEDGIPDNDDLCPLQAGMVKFMGCPDSDQDGVSDDRDRCPEVAGAAKLWGCPDRDDDGVIDIDDECPDDAGTILTKGCPDRDSDGIANSVDECPNEFGHKMLNGCPDDDEDGVANKNDLCTDTPVGSVVDSLGCPLDSDNDGIFDGIDRCPDVKGILKNNGCPLDKKKVEWINDYELQSVGFSKESAEITREMRQALAMLITILLNDSEYYAHITTHVPVTSSADSNLSFTETQMDALVEYLVSKGISKSRISTEILTKKIQTKKYGEENIETERQIFDFKIYR